MKLSEYAKRLGITYQTAWKQFKAGRLSHPAYQLKSGTVIVEYDPDQPSGVVTSQKDAAIYALSVISRKQAKFRLSSREINPICT